MSELTSPVLEMSHITKAFPGVRALDDVTLQVSPGHIHALIGENGAGKSTLMKILAGVYRAGAFLGDIFLNGVRIKFRSPHDARLKGIGYVPQEISVIEALSVAENIFVGQLTAGRGVGVSFRNLYTRAAALLQKCNIGLNPRRPVASLTASERQMVMIARALSMRPSLLILDESTSSLTRGETSTLFDVVRHLQGQGVTTLFITHRLAEIFELGDRVTVLRDGAAVANFDRGAFTQNDIVTAMVGRKLESLYPPRVSTFSTEEVLRVAELAVLHPHIAGRSVVEGVSFSVRRGEILGLAGLVGSGRTEVVNAIYGRLPNTGRIFVDGRPVHIRNPRQAKRHGIGLLTEERKQDGLLFNFTIRENITINNLPAVSRRHVLIRRLENHYVAEYMKRLAIRAPSAETMVGSLSGGNQQKVVLAKALLPQPKVLLLDEPTKGVDVGAKVEIYRLMQDLVRQGIALVVISSELPELLALCDRLIVLAKGRIVDEFPHDEASEERIMLAATGGKA